MIDFFATVSSERGARAPEARRSFVDPLIISAAVTGGEHGREATPYLPVSPLEIAQAAYDAYEAGAAIVHVHVRDDQARPVHDLERYRFVIRYLAERCDMIVNLTTDPGADISGNERLLSLDLEPELASFDAGTMVWGDRVMYGSLGFLRTLATRMNETATKPELEIFHDGMVETCHRLAKENLLVAPLYFQFVLGVPGGSPATIPELSHLVAMIPSESPWSVAGIGRHGVAMAMAAIAMGGHVRVGLEDQIYYSRGVLVKTNAELVARVARLATEFGRPLAAPADARRILGLKGGELVQHQAS
jgi:3-keto-5-aminohexanoate cleavage enzyme